LGLEPAVRYERARPGELVHIDVKKLGRIIVPGHRITGNRRQGGRRTTYTPDGRRLGDAGWEFVHIAIDDCTRLAYAEVLGDEKATTAIAFLRRAVAFFARHGITVEALLTTMARPTAQPSTPSPAAPCTSATCAPARAARRPMARQNGSSARRSAAGPTPRSTATAANAPKPLTAGSGTTTIAADTQPPATTRPSPR
jgi:Integrase core domain